MQNNYIHSNSFCAFWSFKLHGSEKTLEYCCFCHMKIALVFFMPLCMIDMRYWPLILHFCIFNKKCISICVFWWRVIAIKFFQWTEILSSPYCSLPIHIQISCNHSKNLLLFWLNIIPFPPVPHKWNYLWHLNIGSLNKEEMM